MYGTKRMKENESISSFARASSSQTYIYTYLLHYMHKLVLPVMSKPERERERSERVLLART